MEVINISGPCNSSSILTSTFLEKYINVEFLPSYKDPHDVTVLMNDIRGLCESKNMSKLENVLMNPNALPFV